MGRVALVDTDVLVYYTSFACQRHTYTYEGVEYPDYESLRLKLKELGLKPKEVQYEKQLNVLPEKALYSIASRMEHMIRNVTKAEHLVHLISGDTNFRTEVATIQEYKGNRAETEKPVYFEQARDYWLSKALEVSDNEEADDLLGIYATEYQSFGEDCVICSIDKDLNCIPGKHYDWNKQLCYEVPHDMADLWFWRQCLTGDKADNIPGIKGIGDEKGLKMLWDCQSWQERRDVVISQYKKHWGQMHLDVLNEVGRLLWIRRAPGQLWSVDQHEELSL